MTAPVTIPRVTVCVLTYRRPADLAAALPAVLGQVRPLGARGEVLVVDNDPAAGARAQVEGSGARYAHEATPGIAAARNRALDEAAGADLLVFIDDDERPTEGWLPALLDTYLADRPAAVVGPVVSSFTGVLDPWLVAGGFFERRRYPTGTRVPVAATNNLLLDLAQVRALGLRFDLRFGLTGGSDNLFTTALTRAGGRLVWCDEAVVLDAVPAERSTRAWVLRRAYRMGNGSSAVLVVLAGSPARRLARRAQLVGLGLSRVALGLGRQGVGLALGSLGQRAAGARNCARGAGLVTGALGSVYAEYARETEPHPEQLRRSA